MITQGTVQNDDYDDASKLSEHIQRDRRLMGFHLAQETERLDSQRTHTTEENLNSKKYRTDSCADRLEKWPQDAELPDTRSTSASMRRKAIDNSVKELHRLDIADAVATSTVSAATC